MTDIEDNLKDKQSLEDSPAQTKSNKEHKVTTY